jgi:signal transduction histidine kinase
MSEAPKYDILTGVDVPELFRERWQKTLDTLASLLDVRAALVMRVHAHQIEVFSRNPGAVAVYEHRELTPLDTGLYCETVMSERSELAVPDARADPVWDHNPDIDVGMISYLGLPLEWPTGQLFGTICVLDSCPREYSPLHRRTLQLFRDLVQDELALVFENHLLRQEVAEREDVERELREAQCHLQALARHQHVGREQERALLARGLHDEIIQNLTAVKMDLDAYVRGLPPETSSRVRPTVSAIDERIMAVVLRVREMCDNLIPAVLEDLGLVAAVEWAVSDFQRRTEVSCEMHASHDPVRASPDIQHLLFRILQQALSHFAYRHPLSKLSVDLVQHRRVLVLRISAEGHPPSAPDVHVQQKLGLAEMEAEVVSWGGKLRTWRTPEGVAYLEISVPTAPEGSSD